MPRNGTAGTGDGSATAVAVKLQTLNVSVVAVAGVAVSVSSGAIVCGRPTRITSSSSEAVVALAPAAGVSAGVGCEVRQPFAGTLAPVNAGVGAPEKSARSDPLSVPSATLLPVTEF